MPKTVPQDEPVDEKKSPEERPDGEVAADNVAGEPVPRHPEPETGLRGEVDRESLHEAMSTCGGELFHENAPLQEENPPATADDLTSQREAAFADGDVTLPTTNDYSQDEQDPSPPASPSTPIIHPPNLTSPPSPSSSQGTLPVPVPPPSFRSFSLHISPHEQPLATVPSRVLYITVSEHLGARSR